MARYFLQLAYNGTNYHGWQSQDNAHTVQAELEGILSDRLGSQIRITGAGRTDTGVHASNYFAHLDVREELHHERVFSDLTRMMPRDILLKSLLPVKEDAHARFSALSREYLYVITKVKDPFLDPLSFYYRPDINLLDLRAASTHLIGSKDFSSFEKVGSDNSNSVCDVHHAEWIEIRNFLIFRIRANRFLRNMVRSIVGTLIDVGRGKISSTQFAQILESKDRSLAGTSAAAQGLFLCGVEYPSHLFVDQVPSMTEPPSFLTGLV